MTIETRQIVKLTTEEMLILNQAISICRDILEQVEEPDIYNAAKESADGLETLTGILEPFAEQQTNKSTTIRCITSKIRQF